MTDELKKNELNEQELNEQDLNSVAGGANNFADFDFLNNEEERKLWNSFSLREKMAVLAYPDRASRREKMFLIMKGIGAIGNDSGASGGW